MLQHNVIFLWEIGYRTYPVRCTLIRAALWLRIIKIVWGMDVPIRVISTGGGVHEIASCPSSIQESFLILWGINGGPLSAIPSPATMCSLCFAFSQRYSYDLLFMCLHIFLSQPFASFLLFILFSKNLCLTSFLSVNFTSCKFYN